MAKLPQNVRIQHLALGLSAVLLFFACSLLHVWTANGARLGARSVQLTDSTAGATTRYKVTYSGQPGNTIGSVRLQFCSDSPLIGYPCTAPTGFDVSQATVSNQSGTTDWTVSPASTRNVLILTHVPGISAATNSFTLSGVVNPSYTGSYFVRLETFASLDATGSNVDYGGIALSTAANIAISTYVPPYLLFCTGITIQPYDCTTAAGDYIDYGELSSSHTSTGRTQILAATNDPGGYTVRLDGTTLTSGNNVITALSNPNVSRPGTNQFGLNLRANGTPTTGNDIQGPGNSAALPGYDTPDFYKFNPGDVIAAANGVSDYRLYTASYVVNIAKSQPAGVYVSTITYIGLANF